jgi:hypothetical protein
MMKKLLVLTLVLGLASVSYAQILDIEVNGNPWDGTSSVKPSDQIAVSYNHPLSSNGSYAGFQFNVDLGGLVSFTKRGAPPLTGENMAAAQVGAGIDVTGGAAGMPFAPGWWWTLTFHVPEGTAPSTTITLDTVAGGFPGFPVVYPGNAAPGAGDGWGYAQLHVVPEPMTIALLGLGGLMLVRRRK